MSKPYPTQLEANFMCYSTMVERDLRKTARRFGAAIDERALDDFFATQTLVQSLPAVEQKAVLGLARAPSAAPFRWAPADTNGRVYPGHFAPVLVMRDGKRTIVPMRYRIRPRGTPKELPSKYNLFNCRLDAIQARQTWKPLFEKNHVLFPFQSFFEWVEVDGKKREICFNPEGHETMWAPGLYDSWQSLDGRVHFDSFAILTDDPPPEVAAAGHDRCPIFLHHSHIDTWLQPQAKSTEDLLSVLKLREPVHFDHRLAA